MKIKSGDEVRVIAGVYKGKKGTVSKILPKKNSVIVEKINIRTKHIRRTPQRKGERIQYEAPINVSKIQIICSSCSKNTRISYAQPEQGKKYRVCKKCGASLEKTFKKKK